MKGLAVLAIVTLHRSGNLRRKQDCSPTERTNFPTNIRGDSPDGDGRKAQACGHITHFGANRAVPVIT